MSEKLKEVDAELRALRNKKKEMLAKKKQSAAKRKELVSDRAMYRREINETRSKLRKQIANMNSLLSADADIVRAEIQTLNNEAHSLSLSLNNFVQVRDELNELDSMVNSTEDDEFGLSEFE